MKYTGVLIATGCWLLAGLSAWLAPFFERLPEQYRNETKCDSQCRYRPRQSTLGKIFWDPFYTGPRVATFDHVEIRSSGETDVFKVKATDLDDTEGYLALPNVLEKYRALSTGADFYHWEAHYTAQSRMARRKLAQATRARIFVVEFCLPFALVLAGLLASGRPIVRWQSEDTALCSSRPMVMDRCYIWGGVQ
jgi:hypothetical protein